MKWNQEVPKLSTRHPACFLPALQHTGSELLQHTWPRYLCCRPAQIILNFNFNTLTCFAAFFLSFFSPIIQVKFQLLEQFQCLESRVQSLEFKVQSLRVQIDSGFRQRFIVLIIHDRGKSCSVRSLRSQAGRCNFRDPEGSVLICGALDS